MRTLRTLAVSLLVLVAAGFTARSSAAEPESSGLPEGVLAKMARLKSKQLGEPKRRADGGDDGSSSHTGDSPACGSLNVGNVSTGGKRTATPKQITVIVSGDVINANNKCR